MHEFTKEELETLLDLFHYVEDSPSWRETKGWDDILKEKIQAMTDTFCEHETEQGGCGGDFIYTCKKCNKKYYAGAS